MTKSKRIVQIQEGNFVEGIVKAIQTKYPTLDKGNLEQIAKQQIGNHRVLNSVVLSDHDYQGLLRDAQISTERSHLISCARHMHQAIEAGKTTVPELLEILQVALNTNTTYVPEGIDEAAYLQSNRVFAKSILIGIGGEVPVNMSNRITMATDEACLARMVVDHISGFYSEPKPSMDEELEAWFEAYAKLAEWTVGVPGFEEEIRSLPSTVKEKSELRIKIVSATMGTLQAIENNDKANRTRDRRRDYRDGDVSEKILDVLVGIADHLDPDVDNRRKLSDFLDYQSGNKLLDSYEGYFDNIVGKYQARAVSGSLVEVMSAFVGQLSEKSNDMFVKRILSGKQTAVITEVVRAIRREAKVSSDFQLNLEEFNKLTNAMPHIGQKDLILSIGRNPEGELMLEFKGVQNVTKL